MNNIPHNIYDVPLRDNSRIQIIEQLEDLPRARKHQYAAFIRDECSLLVWADSASRVIDDIIEIEKKIIELIWDNGDSVGRYETVVEENDDESELENGYVPPKRGRVLLQPLLVGGVSTLCSFTNNRPGFSYFYLLVVVYGFFSEKLPSLGVGCDYVSFLSVHSCSSQWYSSLISD